VFPACRAIETLPCAPEAGEAAHALGLCFTSAPESQAAGAVMAGGADSA
jgi:hypothetical protein